MNKQKLQEQIDTMREELAKMETELAECEKVELTDVGWTIYSDGNIMRTHTVKTQHGNIRATKELAEIASKNMVTRNKLEAYAHQIDPAWRDGGCGTMAWFIEYHSKCHNNYIALNVTNVRTLGTVYMSKSTAEQICKWLNDGRIEL